MYEFRYLVDITEAGMETSRESHNHTTELARSNAVTVVPVSSAPDSGECIHM